MTNLALIVFLYYTSVWALVSTLIIHVTRFLGFSQLALGWLLSGYGFATMFSEAILVRYIVPWLGETNSMRLGLLSFAAQCVLVAFSSSPMMIFVSVLFSMLANLVYPSISSLVSKIVDEESQGEALGALNGIKALTEGYVVLPFILCPYRYFVHQTFCHLFSVQVWSFGIWYAHVIVRKHSGPWCTLPPCLYSFHVGLFALF